MLTSTHMSRLPRLFRSIDAASGREKNNLPPPAALWMRDSLLVDADPLFTSSEFESIVASLRTRLSLTATTAIAGDAARTRWSAAAWARGRR